MTGDVTPDGDNDGQEPPTGAPPMTSTEPTPTDSGDDEGATVHDLPGMAVEVHEAAQPPAAYMPVGGEWHAILQQADVLAKSDLVPKSYRRKPENIVLAALAGRPFGWDATMAMRSFHIIEGQPSMKPEIMLALIRRAGHKVSGSKTGSGAGIKATVSGVRCDTGDSMTEEFSVDDAVDAGLCTIQDGRPFARSDYGKRLPWEQYPKSMCWARAVSALGRTLFSDVVLGAGYVPEELGAWVDEHGDVLDIESEEVPQWARPDVPSEPVDETTAEALRGRANGLPPPARKELKGQLRDRDIGGFPASMLASKVASVEAMLAVLEQRAADGEWGDWTPQPPPGVDPVTGEVSTAGESGNEGAPVGDDIVDAEVVCDNCHEDPCVCDTSTQTHNRTLPLDGDGDVVDGIIERLGGMTADDLAAYPVDALREVAESVGEPVDDDLDSRDIADVIVSSVAPFR